MWDGAQEWPRHAGALAQEADITSGGQAKLGFVAHMHPLLLEEPQRFIDSKQNPTHQKKKRQ